MNGENVNAKVGAWVYGRTTRIADESGMFGMYQIARCEGKLADGQRMSVRDMSE